MICRRRTDLDLEDVREGFPKLLEKDAVSVAHHILGKAVIPVHVVVEEKGNGSSRTVWFCLRQANPLGEAIHDDIDAFVTAGRLR